MSEFSNDLGRREFLAAGVAGGSLGSWPTLADLRADVSPAPTVGWRFRVPNGSLARTRLVAGNHVYVTSESTLYALSADGTTQWTLSVDSDRPVVRPTSVDEETLYVEVGNEAIYAVERANGEVRWRRGGNDERWRYAVVTDRTVFALGDRLAALSTADGRPRWEFDTEGEGFFEPTVSGGLVLAGTIDGVVHAVDATTGAERWSFERPYDHDGRTELQPVDVVEPESSDPIALVWDRLEGRLHALGVADGSERWRFESETEAFAFPGIVAEDGVFVLDGRSLVALAPADGATHWRFAADEPLSWPTAVEDGTVYVSDGDGTLYALSRNDGSERWAFSTGTDDGVVTNRTPRNVIVADDWDGTLYGLTPEDGSVRWAFEYGSETAWFPQVIDGRVYLGTQDGVVYALDRPSETASNGLRRKMANADGTALGGSLLVGGLLGGLLAIGSRRLQSEENVPEPTTYNDFELFDSLGEGPTGEIHRARTPDGEVVALKRFDASSDEFTDALEAWADLDHDGVLPVREWGIDPEPWVTMAYAESGSLADHLDGLDREEGVEVVSSVAETVHRAHREGVAHGRLHSGNVLFAEADREEVLVSDWLGVATRAELPRGYAAPEEGDEGNPITVDVYQLSALAVHVLTGEPVVGSEIDIEGISDEVADVLETALAPDPEERYESALRFRDMFRWAALQA